jgi:hypothetical protein
MHLSTVHNSNYYSAPPSAANMTSTPCFNMSIGSRIMRHCRPCTSLNGTDATSLYAGPSSTHDFALLARNLDSRQSQGTHTMIIVGIIFAVALGCLCVAAIIGWSVKSNRAAFAKSMRVTRATAASTPLPKVREATALVSLSARSHITLPDRTKKGVPIRTPPLSLLSPPSSREATRVVAGTSTPMAVNAPRGEVNDGHVSALAVVH